jgi:hypothetical protein
MPAQSQTVVAPAAYTTAPDVTLPFEPDTLLLRSEAGSFFFSFDGVNDHGRVIAAESESRPGNEADQNLVQAERGRLHCAHLRLHAGVSAAWLTSTSDSMWGR